ncbi:hypothetical protein CIP107555_02037 [Corynebacterium diphtheriae]|nr:hypothetical protein CIP107555_02037 [Corynebacterium diphtheriae]
MFGLLRRPKVAFVFEFGDWLRGASRGCVGDVPRVGIDSAVFGAVGPGPQKVDTSGGLAMLLGSV